MSKAHQRWKVLPHGRLDEIDDGLLTVVGHITMPLMDLPRRMNVIRLSGERLAVWSAIALAEDEMARLENYGRPAFLIVPNDHHRLDAKIWKDRYPRLQVVAPAGAREKVEQVVPVDTTAPNFGDPHLVFVTVAGTQDREAALIVRTKNGTTLILNDVVGNIRDSSGIGGWFLRRMRFAGTKPQIPRPVKRMMVKDKEALRGQLLRWAESSSLKRILVSHGAPIDNPRQSLRDLAQSLH
jgi:hypothetical protein